MFILGYWVLNCTMIVVIFLVASAIATSLALAVVTCITYVYVSGPTLYCFAE